MNKSEDVLTTVGHYETNVWFISETQFLNSNQTPRVPYYNFFVNNRNEVHRNVKVGSGGV